MIQPYFNLGPFTIGVYGILIALAGVAFFVLGRREFRRLRLDPDIVSGLMVVVFLGALVGGRIAQAIDLHGFAVLWNPTQLLATDGSAFLGGFLGAILLGALYLKMKRQNFLVAMDLIAPGIVLGQAFGRMGCQLSGDGCYGVPTRLPWGMSYPVGIVPTVESVHPTPLYEVAAALLIFAFLWRRRKSPYSNGTQFALFLLLAGTERFLVEFLRLNPSHGGLSQAQWIALGMALTGTAIILRSRRMTALAPAVS